MMIRMDDNFQAAPIIAILRGIQPEQAIDIGEALLTAGIRIIEVPLNSPSPFRSIEKLSVHFGGRCVIGAGTVLSYHQIDQLGSVGGQIAVTPNCNPAVIKHALASGIVPIPGFATTTEAFNAVEAGANYLKLFPATSYGKNHIKALKAVLPLTTRVIAVGGIDHSNVQSWLAAGADGIGLSGGIFSSGDSPETVYQRAIDILSTIQQLSAPS